MVTSARLRLSARVLDESPIPLSQPKRLNAERTAETLNDWAKHGLKSPVTGKRVQLEVIYRGTVLCTSHAALRRFHMELNGFKPRKRKARRNDRVQRAAAG